MLVMNWMFTIRSSAPCTARPSSAGGCPDIAHVGLAFLVARSVGPLHGHEPVPLVEPPRRLVHLEGPQLQTARVPLLSQRDEAPTDSAPAPGGIEVELLDRALREREEADDGAVRLGHPDVVSREQTSRIQPRTSSSECARRTVGSAASKERSQTSAIAAASAAAAGGRTTEPDVGEV